MERKSGAHWVQWADINAVNSKSMSTLEPNFKSKVESFIKALTTAGATIEVTATRRSALRAYLFHWSWMIALEKCKPSDATSVFGVDIQWDHGNKEDSIKGAKEMVKGFGLAVPPKSNVAPAVSSNHILGRAIDMDIRWNNRIKVKNKEGKEVEVSYSYNTNANEKLIEVGKSYGVVKHLKDMPHRSYNGR